MTRDSRPGDEQRNDVLDIEARLTLALEAAPLIRIPEDFTARVMGNLPPARMSIHLTKSHYGRSAMLVCTLLLCVLLAASALLAHQRSIAWLLAQWIVFAQLACIVLGFTLRPWKRLT